jgi:hypothetical protein
MGSLDAVEQDDVFKLGGVADHAVGPHQGVSPDKAQWRTSVPGPITQGPAIYAEGNNGRI